MKKYILVFAVFASLASCDVRNKNAKAINAGAMTNDTNTVAPTTVQLLDSAYDFGKIKEGSLVEFNYRFKNTGNNPLVITNAVGSCGCTVPEKPEQPILPGETGFMKVKFNSENRVGVTHKTVTVSANVTGGFPELVLTGEVLPKDDKK